MTSVSGSKLEFMPHGHCFYWQPDLLSMHVISDGLIALSYFSIPFALMYLARRRPDMRFRRLFIMFAAFILACGVTHVLNIWNFWFADYWLSGYAKVFTAIVSLATAVFLWKIMPRAVHWPTPALLERTNAELRQEITLRKEQELQLQEAFDNAPIGKALVGLDGTWIKVNRALCNILGYSDNELMTMNFQQITYEDDLDDDLNNVSDLIEGKINSYQMEKRYKHKSGHLVWALLSVTLVRDEKDQPRYFISQILDITYRKFAEEELRRTRAELEMRVRERTNELELANQKLQDQNKELEKISVTDSLTKLRNRRSLNEHLDRLLYEAKRYHFEFCLMLIDIDNFKQINDSHGHLLGDEVIRSVSEMLKLQLRQTDIPARFGGDEFCVLLPHTSLKRAPEIADQFRKRIESEIFTTGDGKQFTVTCSIGLAEYTHAIKNREALLNLADEALYQAKQKGRNRVEIRACK